MLPLREYQKRSLEALEEYLGRVNQHGAKTAFVIQTERPYRSVTVLPELPYVCLRVPTGGGKTLMACHALGITAKIYLQAEHAICLWLTPSNVIRDQTLAALRDREHPYRQAVDARFSGQVRVMDLAEALYVQRGTLEGETCIIVSTLAALRVEDTDGRKVYEPAGALSHHFTDLGEKLLAVLERREDGTIPHSLANLLRLWRPVVIMDEAHNARTPLSFETLARFNPSCTIEFTATPETAHQPEKELFASNVLHHVSAAELKAEDMVKLPIKLRTHGDWKEIVAEALQMQRSLEESAKEEEKQSGEYLRPVVLLQAQPRHQQRQTLTVEVVKKSLIEDFKLPEEQIKIATGEIRELDDVKDFFAPTCPVRFIITVQALREGWDCPFAYILCTVSEISTPRAVEQVLGRIIRMPQARRKEREELNCAYAFAASPRFTEAAQALKDALVENGFERLETEDLVTAQASQPKLPLTAGLFPEVSQKVTQKPDLSKLEPETCSKVQYDEQQCAIVAIAPLTEQDVMAISDCFSNPTDQYAVGQLQQASQALSPAEIEPPKKKEAFKVPALAIRVQGELEIFEESHFLDTKWNLAECDASMSKEDFASAIDKGTVGELDINKNGHIEVHFIHQLHEQLALVGTEPGWTIASLANWLDHQIPHPDIPQAQSSLFIHNVLTSLTETRCLGIDELARRKFDLRRAIDFKMRTYRNEQTKKSYNLMLFQVGGKDIEVSPELCFSFTEEQYSPNWYYEGAYKFKKHYFTHIGELKEEGEEFECATIIDQMPDVKLWVRNLERRLDSSFWLQTSSDRFYPDFVAMLNDGRILVIEYKGEDRWSNDDSKEKRAVGDLWADRSKGHCLFVMPKGKDWKAIKKVL